MGLFGRKKKDDVKGKLERIERTVWELENKQILYLDKLKAVVKKQEEYKRAGKAENKPVTIDQIIDTACGYFNVKREDIFTKSRKQAIVQVRQVAMYLAQKYTKLSSARIGALVGNRNHATVLHSCKMVEDRLHVDKTFKAKMEEIEKLLKKR